MQWLEIKVSFEAADAGLAGDLIAAVFYDLGARGVVVDDPVRDQSQDWGADALPLPESNAVTGYLPVDERLNQGCLELNQQLIGLSARLGMSYDVRYNPVDEEDWAESWKAFFHPQKISPRFVVKPTWHDYSPAGDELIIEIDPGMAFGTGTHPTTALCVQLIEDRLRPGQTVLDVGTGSGILLAAAHKLGASGLCGVDSDPTAVGVARENLVLNGVDPADFELRTGHLVRGLARRYDLVVANILADVIVDLLDDIGKVLEPSGCFICSGIIEAYEGKVAGKMAAMGLDLIETRRQGDWVAMAATWGSR
jgi:ribosomal protein L11 methyltransferase